ncbi:MAG: hypothetical protein WA419_17940, partial [Silvibacterium sp.]
VLRSGEVSMSGEVLMTDTVWKCEQVRAGQICDKIMFDTREEAESFLAQMKKNAPDLFWRLEPIAVKMVWN